LNFSRVFFGRGTYHPRLIVVDKSNRSLMCINDILNEVSIKEKE